jgi:hypothetical protein
MTSAGKTPRKKSEKQLLVEALLKTTRGCNWPLEMKMLGQLLKRIPDTKFWLFFGETRRYNTLIHLLSDATTTNIVSKAFRDYTKKNVCIPKVADSVQLELEKVGDDIIIQQKPKTLKDFLNGI